MKGENSVKIFGRDLAELERLSKAVKTEIATVPGVTDPGVFNLLGQPNLVVRIDRAKAARYGFSVGDINAVVQAAIGGQEVTRVYEGEIQFRAHRAARAGISRQRRRDPLDSGRAAEQRPESADRLYRARRSRRGEAREPARPTSTARTASASCR